MTTQRSDWMPFLIFGGLALVALLAILVVLLFDVRRKQASLHLAVLAFVGVLVVGFPLVGDPIAKLLENRHAGPLTLGIRSGEEWLMRITSCFVLVLAPFHIVASLAMFSRFSGIRTSRLLAVFPPEYWGHLDRWGAYPRAARIRLFAAEVLMSLTLIWWVALALPLVLWSQAMWSPGYGLMLFLFLLNVRNLVVWHYKRQARKRAEASARAATETPSPP